MIPTKPLDLDVLRWRIEEGIDGGDSGEQMRATAALDVLIVRVRELNAVEAERDELRATLRSERGEGEGPGGGWRWVALERLGKHCMGWANAAIQVSVYQTGYNPVWVWQSDDGERSERGDERWSAHEAMRDAMRVAVLARGAE